ncbi:MAG TPA: hypothetical protein VFK02_11995 [Kofleriaceae bacterium]|nr:hypothetical protein [Kofleriaceae bacterium]
MQIRIGDIEIDGQVVRIGADRAAPQSLVPMMPASHLLAPTAAATGSLNTLPVRARTMIAIGAAGLVGGAVGFALAPPASLLALVLHVVPLMFGSGALGLGLVKRIEERRARRAARLADETEMLAHVERVRSALRESNPSQTVEWIASTLGLSEPTVVRTLSWLRKRGEVEEELNLDNGEWYYFASSRSEALRGDLESRMAALESKRAE